MFRDKNDIITMIVIIVIIIILGLLAIWAFSIINKPVNNTVQNWDDEPYVRNNTNKNTNSSKENDVNNVDINSIFNNMSNGTNQNAIEKPTVNGIETPGQSISQGGTTKKLYEGFVMDGYIEIPRTGIKYPVLDEVTNKSIEKSVAILCGPGLNKPGNTVIVGHNYRNGMFFSNNKQIKAGDKVYITDMEGNKVTYVVYNSYETTPEDSEYMSRDTNGATEITLATCTDDVEARTVIYARAEM